MSLAASTTAGEEEHEARIWVEEGHELAVFTALCAVCAMHSIQLREKTGSVQEKGLLKLQVSWERVAASISDAEDETEADEQHAWDEEQSQRNAEMHCLYQAADVMIGFLLITPQVLEFDLFGAVHVRGAQLVSACWRSDPSAGPMPWRRLWALGGAESLSFSGKHGCLWAFFSAAVMHSATLKSLRISVPAPPEDNCYSPKPTQSLDEVMHLQALVEVLPALQSLDIEGLVVEPPLSFLLVLLEHPSLQVGALSCPCDMVHDAAP